MADLSALQVAAHVKKRSETLPEPVALSVNREGELTLVFARTAALDAWVDALVDYVKIPAPDLWAGAVCFSGYLSTDDGVVPTTLVLP